MAKHKALKLITAGLQLPTLKIVQNLKKKKGCL